MWGCATLVGHRDAQWMHCNTETDSYDAQRNLVAKQDANGRGSIRNCLELLSVMPGKPSFERSS